jgi:hypothetical protein
MTEQELARFNDWWSYVNEPYPEDAICEACSRETSLYCSHCRVWTCTHLSLWSGRDALSPNGEQEVHRCNWCERELEANDPMTDLLQRIADLLQYIELLNRPLTEREVAKVAALQREVEQAIHRKKQDKA